jgi:hypothetical protein
MRTAALIFMFLPGGWATYSGVERGLSWCVEHGWFTDNHVMSGAVFAAALYLVIGLMFVWDLERR